MTTENEITAESALQILKKHEGSLEMARDLNVFAKLNSTIMHYQGSVQVQNFKVGDAVIVVEGDLIVEDTLEDCEGVDASLLIVLGNVSCKNLFNLSAMHISGNLEVKNVLVGDSLCDYCLAAGGNVDVPVILDYGHSVQVAGTIQCPDVYSFHYVKDKDGFRKTNLPPELMVPAILKTPHGNSIDLANTVRYVRNGGIKFRK